MFGSGPDPRSRTVHAIAGTDAGSAATCRLWLIQRSWSSTTKVSRRSANVYCDSHASPSVWA
eukprot:2291657-Rhodomonas_salina.1